MTERSARLTGSSGSEGGCAHCAHGDQLVAVPAAVAQGTSSSEVRGYVRNSWGTRSRVRARVASRDALAQMLAPPPAPHSMVGPAVGLGAGGFLGLAMLQAGAVGDTSAVFFVPLFLGFAAVSGVVLWRRNRPGPRRTAAQALELWGRCWYCRRCGEVTLRRPDGRPVRLAARGLVGQLRSIAARQVEAARVDGPAGSNR